jgi:hypothetical protein
MKIILFYFEIYSNLNNYLDQVCQNPFYNEHGYLLTECNLLRKSGHGGPTVIGIEKISNIFVKFSRSL